MRRDFIANVSHELKTPLTVISGFVETLQDMDLDAAAADALPAADAGAGAEHAAAGRRSAHAVRAGKRAQPGRRERFAIVPLLLELSGRRAKALSKGERTTSRSTSATPRRIVGSRDELASAFGNLVSNAIRYTPVARAAIALALARRSRTARGVFGLTDSGIGIAPEHVAAPHRAFLSRRPRALARDRRHGPRSRDRQARAACATRPKWTIVSEIGRGRRFGSPAGAASVERAAGNQRHDVTHRAPCRRLTNSASAARNRRLDSSSAPTSTGAFLMTRYCGSAPSSERIDLIVAEPQRGETVRHTGLPASTR